MIFGLFSSNLNLYAVDTMSQVPIVRVRAPPAVLVVGRISLRKPSTIHGDEDLVSSVQGNLS